MDRALTTEVDGMASTLVEWRRDFHRHPETAFQEHRTSSVVRAFLEATGIEVRACGKTGLRGILRGGRPGRTVALRADMDALPVAEIAGHDPFMGMNAGFVGLAVNGAITLTAMAVAGPREAELKIEN